MIPRDNAPNVESKNEVKDECTVCPGSSSLKGVSTWSGNPASGDNGVLGVFGGPWKADKVRVNENFSALFGLNC